MGGDDGLGRQRGWGGLLLAVGKEGLLVGVFEAFGLASEDHALEVGQLNVSLCEVGFKLRVAPLSERR